ncbi:MAG: lipoprotein [Comamonadaceae bacterium]|nr:MAG: lipoprotein [Comamonadaceae bacterium]
MMQGINLRPSFWRRLGMSGFLMALLVTTGCASSPNANPKDPLEPFNRGVYQFNDAVDRAVIKPVATVYKEVMPQPVRTGVDNFFNNLQDAWSIVNNALQFKGEAAGNSLVRFGVNTFWGLGGVLDIATEMQIERSTEDFGQTLGYWGVGSGPYLVLPLLGPSTVRDTVALPVDAQGNLLSRVNDVPARNSATALNLLDRRARLLKASDMLDEVALDPYTFTRDAFLQRRRNQVYDGNPPDEAEPDVQEQPAN